MRIPVVYSTDNNYLFYTIVSITSLCESANDGTEYIIYILLADDIQDNHHLINTTKERFKSASDLLNYGFANYENYIIDATNLINISYKDERNIKIKLDKTCSILIEKGQTPNYTISYFVPTKISKCKLNQELGYIEIVVDGEVYSTIKVLADEEIEEPSFVDNLKDIYEDFV